MQQNVVPIPLQRRLYWSGTPNKTWQEMLARWNVLDWRMIMAALVFLPKALNTEVHNSHTWSLFFRGFDGAYSCLLTTIHAPASPYNSFRLISILKNALSASSSRVFFLRMCQNALTSGTELHNSWFFRFWQNIFNFVWVQIWERH